MAWDQASGSDTLKAAAALCKVRALLDGALVTVAGRLEETGAADAAGWASVKDLLTHLLGGRKGAGAGLVRVAKQAAGLPQVREALVHGEISLPQAGVIAGRVATLPQAPDLRADAADRMLGLVAEHGYDATDLDRSFAGVVRELDPDGSLLRADLDKDKAERGAHRARFLSFATDTLGGVRIKGYATVEDVEMVKTVLMPLAAPVVTEPGACGGTRIYPLGRDPETGRLVEHGCPDPDCFHNGKDPRDHGARLWDALVETCRRLQDADEVPRAHGAAARLVVTLPLADLQQGLGEAALTSGEALSAAAVRRLACDAEVIPAVLGTDGQILDVGRASRLVTPGLWTALVLRDQHCAFPGCTRLPLACDAHHVVHWADGGATSLDNLLLLCRRHHTVVHRTPWEVRIAPDTGRPEWIPPPLIDDSDRFSYSPARPRHPSSPDGRVRDMISSIRESLQPSAPPVR